MRALQGSSWAASFTSERSAPLIPLMPRNRGTSKARSGGAKLARAKIRHFFLTVAPDRLMRGALKRRYLERPIELRELTLHVPSWPERFDGMRIAHVSDFHLGELMPMARALEIIERVDKAKPDLLACTGDVVDLEWAGAEPLLQAMGSVVAPLGRYLVLGNHDYLDDPAALVRAARKRGLTVLEDEVAHASIRARTGRGGAAGESRAATQGALRVGGIDWGRTKRELSDRVDSLRERPDLLLAHNPKAFPAAARHGVPLMLAGHTHGGQVGLPDRTVRVGRSARAAPPHAGESGLSRTAEAIEAAARAAGATAAEAAAAGAAAAEAGAGAAGSAIAGAGAGSAAVRAAAAAGSAGAARAIAAALPARVQQRAWRRGLYAQGESRLFVNVGAGSWFPARVNCPAEIVVLTVTR